jgi:nucleotide-binding universal stress UspA family protein
MTRNPVVQAAIRRILVAVDGSAHSLAALEAAATLAAQLQAELEALFVEDVDLLRLADLPCARVVSLSLQQTERTDRARMERQLRLQAARARASLEQRAAALGVRATFRSVRGKVIAQVLDAAGEADLLTLGRAGHGGMSRPRGGSTLQAALAAGRLLLVAESRGTAGQGLLAVYDGSEASGRALTLAGQLAAKSAQLLSVLILPGSAAEAERWASQVRRRLAGLGVTPDLSYSWTEPGTAVLAAARRVRPALLLLSCEHANRVLEAVHCPLLVVP